VTPETIRIKRIGAERLRSKKTWAVLFGHISEDSKRNTKSKWVPEIGEAYKKKERYSFNHNMRWMQGRGEKAIKSEKRATKQVKWHQIHAAPAKKR